MKDNRTAKAVDKINKNRYVKLTSLIFGFLAAVLGIFAYVYGPDIRFECSLREAATTLDYSLQARKSEEVFGKAYFDEESSEFVAVLEFNERVNFGSGTQIFRDINRVFAINNIAQELVQTLASFEQHRSDYVASVSFRGGADASGGPGYFAKPLNIGDLVLAARSPTINDIMLDETPEFKTGMRINNESLALIRASYVAHIFITKLDESDIKIVFDDAYFARIYGEIGPRYRYGKIEVKVTGRPNVLPEMIPPEIICGTIA